jgi:hypothetical protein
MARFPSPLDGGSSILLLSLSKNLTLVATGSWIGRRRGIIVTGVDTPS